MIRQYDSKAFLWYARAKKIKRYIVSNIIRALKIVYLSVAALALAACASSRSQFQPEAGADGAKVSRGGLVYSIPPAQPVLKMKLLSAGVGKGGQLKIQMFFHRIGDPAPREQYITLDDSKEAIYPVKVHASVEGKPMIRLGKYERQAIELLFQLPKTGSGKMAFFMLNWKLHYTQAGQKQEIAEAERFDLIDKPDLPRGVGQYDREEMIFPYAGYDDIPESWTNPGWMWW
jgi:hypothetical protein